MEQKYIRNFCIIAHIDHGKSTLADRMLELTGTVASDKIVPQMLDRNPIERERGITIKLQPVRMLYRPQLKIEKCKLKITDSKQEFVLNLIDTPGHVDFSYEVSRSLAAVEGAILLVDASQGIQAQTQANLAEAKRQNLTIIPVINKVDLAHAQPEKVALEVAKLLNCCEDEIVFASGKTGEGVGEVLDKIVEKIPPPSGDPDKPLRALIFDSIYDKHRGVIVFIRIVDGKISTGEGIKLLFTDTVDQCLETGILIPDQLPTENLLTGQIGYIVTGQKDIRKVRVGDTLSVYTKGDKNKSSLVEPLPGYRHPVPMVYASIFPTSPSDYPLLRESLQKYELTDGSITIEPENSPVLGFGYRLGFLGLLHIEIVSERLLREYNLDLLITTPQVEYQVVLTNNETKIIHSVPDMPDRSSIKQIQEPWAKLVILSPSIYLGKIIELIQSHRVGRYHNKYIEAENIVLNADIPLSELIIKFYDELKTITQGYGSMSYELSNFKEGKLTRLDIRLSDEPILALSSIVPADFVERIAKEKVEKLKEIIPKQQFEVKIQAAVGRRIIASERISAFRKDVTAKLYGGDVTRKRKLLEKQAKGKKRLRQFGKVSLPSDIFIKLLKTS